MILSVLTLDEMESDLVRPNGPALGVSSASSTQGSSVISCWSLLIWA